MLNRVIATVSASLLSKKPTIPSTIANNNNNYRNSRYLIRYPPSAIINQRLYKQMSSSADSNNSNSNTDCIIVYITVPNSEVADKISSELVNNELCACVNIIPGITSVYKWEGKVNKDTEMLLMCKSQLSIYNSIVEKVRSIHPYKVPEIISVPIKAGNQDYLQWIRDNTKLK